MYMFTRNTRISGTKAWLAALAVTAMMGQTFDAAYADSRTPPQQTILTLEHLKNATYQIPDLTCGYTLV